MSFLQMIGSASDGYVLYTPLRTARLARRAAYALLSGVGIFVAIQQLDLPLPFLAVWAIGVLVTAFRSLRRVSALRVDGAGVTFGDVMAPWSSIHQLVVLRPDPAQVAGLTQIGLRLRPQAPLPDGIDGLVTDPNDPLAIPEQLRTDIAQEIDIDTLLAAARRLAPPAIELVEQVGGKERELRR